MSEKEILFFNQLAERWDDLRSADQKKISMLVGMINISEGDSIVDVGSGTGVLLPFLKHASGESGQITAIDFAANMIALSAAKHRHLTGITYVTGDILGYEAPQPFDKIVCFNFFPHISDKPVFLHQVKHLLKPGGMLVIMHDISRHAVNAIHQTSDIVKNDRLPDSKAVSELLQLAGYSVQTATDNDEYYFIKAVTAEGSLV